MLPYATHTPEMHRLASDSRMKATRSNCISMVLNPSLPGMETAAGEASAPDTPKHVETRPIMGSCRSGCSMDRMKPRLDRGREETCRQGVQEDRRKLEIHMVSHRRRG